MLFEKQSDAGLKWEREEAEISGTYVDGGHADKFPKCFQGQRFTGSVGFLKSLPSVPQISI